MSARQKSKAKSLPPKLEELTVNSQDRIAAMLRSGDRVIIEVEQQAASPNKIRLGFDAIDSSSKNGMRLRALMFAVASMLEQ